MPVAPPVKGFDPSAGIRIYFYLWYIRWRRLRAAVNVMMRKEIVHLLHVVDHTCRPMYRLGQVDSSLFLRQYQQQQAAKKKDGRAT